MLHKSSSEMLKCIPDIKISNAFVSSQLKADSRTPVITFADLRKVHTQMVHLSRNDDPVPACGYLS